MSDRARRIPEATVARLPVYLRSLMELADEGIKNLVDIQRSITGPLK